MDNRNHKLTEWRREKGLSQVDLANRLSISRTCYLGYELGGRMPSARALLELEMILERPVRELYESFENCCGYMALSEPVKTKTEVQVCL